MVSMQKQNFQTDDEYRAFDKGYHQGITLYKKITIQLYDALENLVAVLYADGPRQKDFNRAEKALGSLREKNQKRTTLMDKERIEELPEGFGSQEEPEIDFL